MTGTACAADICCICQEVLVWLPSRICHACTVESEIRLTPDEMSAVPENRKEVPRD